MSTVRLELSDHDVGRIAAAVIRMLEDRQLIGEPEDHWMSTKQSAAYLGTTPNALHKLTGKREIPFEQDARGGKCWFRKSDLDAWRGRP